MTGRALPRWPEVLLRWMLPPGDRSRTMLGDLYEEFSNRPPGHRRSIAYAIACVGLAAEQAAARCVRAIRRMPAPTSALAAFAGELRQSVAGLRRSPGYAVASVAALSLGLAAALTIATIVYGALLRPLGFHDPQTLVRFGNAFPTSAPGSISSMSPANFLDLQRSVHGFAGMGAYALQRSILSTPAMTERALGAQVTGNLLDVLGVEPLAGRTLTAADDHPSAAAVVVIGAQTADAFFGGGRQAVGQRLLVDLVPHTVIGVVPVEAFLPGSPQFWVPFRWTAANAAVRRRHGIEPIGRLDSGISLREGLAELKARAADLAREFPAENGRRTIEAVPLPDWIAQSTGRSTGAQMQLIAVGAASLLVVALINAATLAVSRGEQRRRELLIRRALGASRGSILRLRLAEATAVVAPATVAGMLMTAWLVPVVLARFGDSIPRASTIGVDGATAVAALAGGLAAALVIALASGGRDRSAADVLRADGRTIGSGRAGLRRLLVTTQIGLAGMLLYGALVVAGTLWALSRVDLGVNPDQTVLVGVGLPAQRYPAPADVNRFFENLLESVRAVPDVQFAGATSRLPFFGGTNGGVTSAADPSKSAPLVEWRAVTPGLFSSLGLQRVAGGDFARSADADANRAIVSESLAAALFGRESAVGQRVAIDNGVSLEIVGVVKDFRDMGPTEGPRPTIYFRHGSAPGFASSASMTLVVRSRLSQPDVVALIRKRVRDLDPDVPIDRVTSLRELAQRAQGLNRRTAASLLSLFTGFAILLAAIGIGGVVAFNVQRRTREFGVRLALGATSGDVVRGVLAEGVVLAALGVGMGGIGAIWVHGAIKGVVVATMRPPDWLVGLLAAAVLGAVSLLASAWPARRASRVPVAEALRSD